MGKQWLMILWSVDCPACFKEMALIQKLKNNFGKLPVVFINADDNDEVMIERAKILDGYRLDALDNYYFIDGQSQQSRYLIDPNWYGELPRSYFFDKNGKFYGKSGLIDEKLLKRWLLIQ